MAIINNKRQSGEYTEWTKKDSFKPYGSKQRVNVSLNMPTNSVIYEFTQSKMVKHVRKGNRSVVSLNLPAYGGRLLCIYPEKIDKLKINLFSEYSLASENEIIIELLNKKGKNIRGLQVVDIEIIDHDQNKHDESGLYQMQDGKTIIPLRIAKNDTRGEWRIHVKEKTSGINSSKKFKVR